MPYAGNPAQAGDGCEAPVTSRLPHSSSVCLIGSLCCLSRPGYSWLVMQVAKTAAAMQYGPGTVHRQQIVQEHSHTVHCDVLLLQHKVHWVWRLQCSHQALNPGGNRVAHPLNVVGRCRSSCSILQAPQANYIVLLLVQEQAAGRDRRL